MHKKTSPKDIEIHKFIPQFPHCDPRILHAPGECEFCDRHPDWQALRSGWWIAFTGYTPDDGELPCPADHARGDSHTQWAGNVASQKFQSSILGVYEQTVCGTSKAVAGYWCTRELHHTGPCAAIPYAG